LAVDVRSPLISTLVGMPGEIAAVFDASSVVTVLWARNQPGNGCVRFDYASVRSDGWIDFRNLLRINGVWKITNKSATHSSR